jgi:prepilin-type N-terminal cleavage/methylation domain-containing protein
MKTTPTSSRNGFTLVETVIAIGVLAVLLTGFMIVFAPAAAGIKKAISRQEADRLASTLEQELVTWRTGNPGTTGFEKAFTWIRGSNTADTAVLVYQYRGLLKDKNGIIQSPRSDGTLKPASDMKDLIPGEHYVLRTMVRLKDDPLFINDDPTNKGDLFAVEGSIYLVKCTQLIFENGKLEPGDPTVIVDPINPGDPVVDADAYPEAVIAFKADYFALSGKQSSYFDDDGRFETNFDNFTTPVFTRNLAVAR